MERFLEGNFFNPTRGDLKFNEVIGEIIGYILERPEMFYDVIVGCDSSSSEEPHFPVAVVVLRVGEGGRFFLKEVHYQNRKFYNFKQRVLEEVLLSCEFALHLRENLENAVKTLSSSPKYQFRYIHADVGEKGATCDMIKEVTGLIKGNGFEPQIKPFSFAASVVADRYT